MPTRAVAAATLVAAVSVSAQGSLENPQPGGSESGISLVSGWHCDADTITVQFDGLAPIEAAYGTARGDTQGACGDTDNGFGLLTNFNLLGGGQHTVRVFADGVQFGSATFGVATLGQPFVRGLSQRAELTLLDVGKEIGLSWQQGKQGFVIDWAEDAEFTLAQLVAALSGTWAGSWDAPGGSGSVSLTVGASPGGNIEVRGLTLSNTGCAANSATSAVVDNINDPYVEIQMTDGSRVELDLLGTENLSALGGAFWFASGPCADVEGIFHAFRQ